MSVETMGVTPISLAGSASPVAEAMSSGVSSVSTETFTLVNSSQILSQTVDYHPIFDADLGVSDRQVTLSPQEILAMPELQVDSPVTQALTAETLIPEIAEADEAQLAEVRAELATFVGTAEEVDDSVSVVPQVEWEGLVFDTAEDKQVIEAPESIDAELIEEGASETVGNDQVEQTEEEIQEKDISEIIEEEDMQEEDLDEEQSDDEDEKEKEDEEEEEQLEEDEPPIEIGPVVDERTNGERLDTLAEAAQDSALTNNGEVEGKDMAAALITNADRLQSGIVRRQGTVGEDGTIPAITNMLQRTVFSTPGVALLYADNLIKQNVAVDLGDIRAEHPATEEEVAKVTAGPITQMKHVRHI